MLTLYRTPIVLGSNPGARVCFVEATKLVDPLAGQPPEAVEMATMGGGKTGLAVARFEKLGTWPAIENADDPDKMPAGEYELIMTRMDSSKRPALWLEGAALFLHGLLAGREYDRNLVRAHEGVVGRAKHLKGCPMPALLLTSEGAVQYPDRAMLQILEALGGFEEKKRVPFRCIELGELPAARFEITELLDDDSSEEEVSYPLRIGERLTRLPNGDVLVEREIAP